MIICGIKGTSLIDYPGKVATVIYANRCNFRCPFCHNPQLASGNGTAAISQAELIGMISTRSGFIDGVVITGGEPTLQSDLENFINAIKTTGLLIKLDTNGSHPEVLENLLAKKRLDFVAMDIKTSLEKYNMAAGVKVDIMQLRRSIALIRESGIDHEFRTTCVPSIVNGQDILEISQLVGKGSNYTLQQFQPENTLDPAYLKIKPYSSETLQQFAGIARQNVKCCRLTGV